MEAFGVKIHEETWWLAKKRWEGRPVKRFFSPVGAARVSEKTPHPDAYVVPAPANENATGTTASV
jgi:hypothetical protein